MKEKLKKVILIIFTIGIVFNGIIGTVDIKGFNEVQANETDELADDSSAVGSELADVLLGIALYIPKAGAYAVLNIIEIIVRTLGGNGGTQTANVTIGNVIFNEVDITSIDFFDTSNTNSSISAIRKNIATWYYALRNLSIVILLGILLYVGIRMVISTVAEEEAKYKKMLKDWVVSLLLVFVLHYIMIFVIEINNVLVDILKPAAQSRLEIASVMQNLNIWHPKFTVGVGSLCVYAMLVGMSLMYLIMYIKRMLTIGFLIIISPLITITYSIDKMGDGRSQALNSWLKEFIFNVLIQPFHCIIYIVFVTAAIDLLGSSGVGEFSGPVLAVVMMIFTFQAEKIIRKIFNFQAASLGEALGSAAAITAGISFLQKRGDKDSKENPKLDKMPNMGKQNMYPGSANAGASTGANTATGTGSGGATGAGAGAVGAGEGEGSGARAAGAEAGTGEGTGAESAAGSETSAGAGALPEPAGETGADNSAGSTNTQGSQRNSQDPTRTTSSSAEAPNRRSNFLNKDANRRAALRLADSGKKYMGKIPKLSLMMALGALGLATGTFKGATAGMYAGASLGNGLTARMNRSTANRRVRENERAFAGAYKNFQAQTGKSDTEMKNFTQGLMDGTIDKDNLTEEERMYSSYVSKMAKTYNAVGEDDVESRMMETLEMIAPSDGSAPRITPEFAEGQWQPVAQEQPAAEPEPEPEPEPENQEDLPPTFEGLGEVEQEYLNYKQDFEDYNDINPDTGRNKWEERMEREGNYDAEAPTFEKYGELEERYNKYQQDLIDYNTTNPDTGRNVWEEKRERRRGLNNSQNNNQNNGEDNN